MSADLVTAWILGGGALASLALILWAAYRQGQITQKGKAEIARLEAEKQVKEEADALRRKVETLSDAELAQRNERWMRADGGE